MCLSFLVVLVAKSVELTMIGGALPQLVSSPVPPSGARTKIGAFVQPSSGSDDDDDDDSFKAHQLQLLLREAANGGETARGKLQETALVALHSVIDAVLSELAKTDPNNVDLNALILITLASVTK